MEKQDQWMRAADGGIVFMICLLQLGLICSFLLPVIGLWAVLLAEGLSIVVVLAAARRTRLKTKAYFAFGLPSVREIAGSALFYTAALLVVIPTILFGHLIVPNFAMSSFHIGEQRFYSLPMLLAVLTLAAFSETILFDGYLFSRFRSIGGPVKSALLIAALCSVYHLEMFLLIPLFAIEFCLIVVRRRTKSMLIPSVLHLLTGLLSVGALESASADGKLLGMEMGAASVAGLALIFLGAAIPTAMLAGKLLPSERKIKPVAAILLLSISLLLVAVGCGVSGFST